MKKLLVLALAALPILLTAQTEDLTKIAFGSCSMHWKKQKIWNEVLENNPQLWIWLGDNIYGQLFGTSKDVNLIKERYDKALANPNYQKLIAKVPIIGTWDDHDFGGNDIGNEFGFKKETQQLHLDFMGVSKDSPRRQQEGVYGLYSYGSAERKVKVILLDTRYFREKPGDETDMLGEAQWTWLEKELTDSDAAIHIIGTSVQFVSDLHGYEGWGHFKGARTRMLKLIKKTKAPGVIFISGDRHISEICALNSEYVDYPIYDFTSSGLTHGRAIWPFEKRNPYRMGRMWLHKNFGIIEIDWEKRNITFQTRNKKNKVVIERTISINNLQPKS